MRTTQKHPAIPIGPIQASSLATLAILVALHGWGCTPSERLAQTTDEAAYAITLDRTDNGAAVASDGTRRAERNAMPRTLSFEMAGFSAYVPGDALEQRSAVAQAAIIDAFCKALIEARRSRGQSDAEFTAQLGPRLTVTHCTTEDGYEAQINLISRGIETTFVVCNGELQHPPRDMQWIHRMFESTNGEFSLLGTRAVPEDGTCMAKVGCYLPAGLGEAVAGPAAADANDSPESP